jgi:alpha-beta hydrolase superfamily lysophospholipase
MRLSLVINLFGFELVASSVEMKPVVVEPTESKVSGASADRVSSIAEVGSDKEAPDLAHTVPSTSQIDDSTSVEKATDGLWRDFPDVESQSGNSDDSLLSGIYTSHDDEKIFYRFWDPLEGNPSALVVIVHGMAEHSERYESFAYDLANVLQAHVVAPDLRGHGYTACCGSEGASQFFHLGLLRKGEKAKCEDAVSLMSKDVIGVIEESSDLSSLPIVLIGHSMGSVVVRALLKNASSHLLARIKGVVLSGVPTAPSAIEVYPLTLVGEFIKRTGLGAEFVKKNFVTGKFDSQLKTKLRHKNVEENSFISSDPVAVKTFTDGILTNHLVDPEILISIVHNLRALQSPASYFTNLKDQTLHFLFVSGRDDPVCSFGATAAIDAENLRYIGQSVSEIYIGNSRHEFINEVEPIRSDAISQVTTWIQNKLK